MPKREAEDLAARAKDAWVALPSKMPIDAVAALPGVLVSAVRQAFDRLQPYERATTKVRTITVDERERFDDGRITYEFRVDYEHDCPNAACDNCIGDD